MKHSLSHFLSTGVLAISMMMSTTASADVLLKEDFNSHAGDMHGPGGWLQSNNKSNAIQVTTTKLSLDGFASGNSVKLTPESSQDQDVQKPFVALNDDNTYTGITDGTVYAAMLINVQNVTHQMYFTAFGTTTSTNIIKDNASFTGPYGSTFVIPSDNEGKYRLGIAKNT